MTRVEDHVAGDAGFALIEALASLVIVGMLALMLMAGVRTGKQVWERMDARSAAGEAIEGAQSVVRQRLEQMYPATLYGGAEATSDITGQQDSLVFLAPPDGMRRPAPLRRYRLFLDDRQDLLLASISDVADPRDPGVTNQILLRGVQTLDIAYFGAAPPDMTRRWRSNWKQLTLPPELVRVRIGFAAGDRRVWPDLIVHPLVTIDSGCILSAATSHCRGR